MSDQAQNLRKLALLPETVVIQLRRRCVELVGLAMIVVGLAIGLALISYAPDDPSLNTATGRPVVNLMGVPGAYLADLLLQFFGICAYLPAVALAGWGWRLTRNYGLDLMGVRIVSLMIAMLAGAGAVAVFNTPPDWLIASGAGGVIGGFLSEIGRSAMVALSLPVALPAVFWAAVAAGTLPLIVGVPGRDWQALSRAGWAGAVWSGRAIGRLAMWSLRRARRSADDDIADPPEDTAAAKPAKRRRKAADNDPDAGGRAELVVARQARNSRREARERQGELALSADSDFVLPTLNLLTAPPKTGATRGLNDDGLAQNARMLESVLEEFGVRGDIVRVRQGPVVTRYELEPAPGTRSARVISLADDIARSMSAVSARVAVVPGENVIGIELPNTERETVFLRELLSSSDYERTATQLPLVLGKDISGAPVVADLARMPHLLVAGTTGSGKSVAVNSMILSLLYRLRPDECRLILIDPKMLELSVYDEIPHLLHPVVTEPPKAVVALKWAVKEMNRRYRLMSNLNVRNIAGYNKRLEQARDKGEQLTRTVQVGFDSETGQPLYETQPLDMEPMPLLVIVVDEMADLMLVAGKDIEVAIQSLAQKARAAGIHLIIATQRPSVDVITGTIKANLPTRISFQVTSKIDSRTILGEQGAEQLLGMGDMLYMAGGGQINRVHGPFVSEDEVEEVANFLREQGEPDYLSDITEDADEAAASEPGRSGDELYDRALDLVARERKASTSFIQRHLQIGYNRAARIIEKMEAEGVVSQANHVGKREVLIGEVGENVL